MQTKVLFLPGASLICCATAFADPIHLKDTQTDKNNGNTYNHVVSQLPFSVDVTFGQLTLHMTNTNSLCMVVTGPDGVVLTKEITSTGYKIESFDLTPYSNGEYEIHIIDAQGNDVSGEFFKGTGKKSSDEE